MTYDFSQLDTGLQAAKEWLMREYAGVRTGRATPAILDSIGVSAYGSIMPIKQVANISVEDARTLRVIPFDMSVAKDIERAIAAANLGVGTNADSAGLRVTFPDLTGERRAELVKIAKQKLEEARTAVRVARDECWKAIQEGEREGDMSEDEKFTSKDAMQKKVDEANGGLEQLFNSKEKEMGV
jgi:ribosome recycling factor